jgi:TonB-dependent receptor
LNGLDVPGLDPDRNSLQMDIFPTNIIDNIIVHKSFSAELPASFTGGIVDIHTKDFPDNKQSSISLGLGYNPNYHFKSNFLSYEGGKTDWLGFDDGSREIPATGNIPNFVEAISNPEGENGIRYKEILSSFNPTMAAMKQNSFLDISIGANFANQKKLEKLTLGYSFAMSYKNSTDFYENAVFAKYGMSPNKSINELQQREYQIGDYGVNNVLLSGMAGFAIKTMKSKIRFNLLHLQNGEKKAGIFDYSNNDQGAVFEAVQHNLDYSQKSLSNLLIHGKHVLDNSKWTIEWKISPTYSTIKDPDIRFTRYEKRGNSFHIGTESGFPERIWRDLTEINIASLVDFTREFQFNGHKSKFKFGGAYVYKERNFNIKSFSLNVRNIPLTGNPNELFYEENLWPYNGDVNRGTTFETSFLPVNPNQFTSNNRNAAVYSSIEINPFERLRTIVGLRIESFNQYYTGQDQLGANVLQNDLVLENIDLFPTVNMIYKLTEKQNLRIAYSKTIARPSFKELSYAEIYDPISGTTFVGGLFRDADDFKDVVYWDGNLVSTDIHNMDLRWEFYNKLGNSISIAGFYKMFNNPIEIVQYSIQSGSFQPRNVGDATVIGGEIEANQYLDFISKKLQNFSINANFTLVESRVELSNIEYQSRLENAREGQTIDKYRDMANQAPYIINAGISYRANNKSKLQGFEAALFYNVQGPTLQFVGIVDRPDIYEEEFHSLNMNLNYKFGINDQMKIGFKVSNILNDKKASYYDSFGANPMYFRSLYMGRTASLSFSYSFH